MQEEPDGDLMHLEGFGEKQGFAREAAQALARGVVKTPDVVGGPFGIRGAMLGGGQDVVITLKQSVRGGP